MPIDLRRLFIKKQLKQGTSAKEVRDSFNALVRSKPEQIDTRWGKFWRRLSGLAEATAKEVHKFQSSLGRLARAERKTSRAEMAARTASQKLEATILGIPEPTIDAQKAHDAGVMFRATHDEKYREKFTEGS